MYASIDLSSSIERKERKEGRKEGLSSRARTILRGGEFVGRPLARVPENYSRQRDNR